MRRDSGIARAHPAELHRVAGIGPAVAARLSAAFELGRRVTMAPAPASIESPRDIAMAAAPLLHGRTRERAVAVICSGRARVLGCEILSEGSAERTPLPVRETLTAVLRRDGQAFALAHNHPDGEPTPSDGDIAGTAQVGKAANAIGLRFLGHVVVTDTAFQVVPIPS